MRSLRSTPSKNGGAAHCIDSSSCVSDSSSGVRVGGGIRPDDAEPASHLAMSSVEKSEAPPWAFIAQTRKPYSFPCVSPDISHRVSVPAYTFANESAAEP